MAGTPVTDTLELNERGNLELRGTELITGTVLEVEHAGHWVPVKVDAVKQPGIYIGVLPDGQTIELRPGMQAVIEPRTTV